MYYDKHFKMLILNSCINRYIGLKLKIKHVHLNCFLIMKNSFKILGLCRHLRLMWIKHDYTRSNRIHSL